VNFPCHVQDLGETWNIWKQDRVLGFLGCCHRQVIPRDVGWPELNWMSNDVDLQHLGAMHQAGLIFPNYIGGKPFDTGVSEL